MVKIKNQTTNQEREEINLFGLKKLKTEIASISSFLSEGNVVSFITSRQKIPQLELVLLKYLTNQKNKNGLYISMNRPFSTLINDLERNNVSVERLFFIDVTGERKTKEKNCVALNPYGLEKLSVIISETYRLKDIDFIFLDTLSNLLVYHNEATVLRFFSYISTKIKLLKLSGIIFFLEVNLSNEMIKNMNMFCDKIVEIK